MLLPQSLAEPIRKPSKKKTMDAVSLFANSSVVQELAVAESGNSIKCFIPVSLGDKLSVKFHIPCGEFEVVDLIVDGVLRNTKFSHPRLNTHKGTFTRVCHCERQNSGSMSRIRSFEMVVAERTKEKDVGVGLGNMTDVSLAAVGTIEVRVYRQMPAIKDEVRGALLAQADRGPIFEKFAAWWEVNNVVDINGGDPSYQIGFTDPKHVYGSTRKNIKQEISGFYLWASFKYVYRSISMLKAMGFTVDEAYSGPSIKPEEDQSPCSEGLAHSPMAISYDAVSGEESFSEEENQAPLAEKPKGGPAFLSYSSIGSQPTSLTSKGIPNISKLADVKRTRYLYSSLDKKRVFGDDFPIPVDDNYQGSSEGEEDLSSSFERGETKHGEGNNNLSGFVGLPLSRFAAHGAQPKAEDAHATRKPEVGVKVDKSRNSIPEMNALPSTLHEVSQRGREVDEASRNSSQSSHPFSSFYTEADSKSIHVEPKGDNDEDHNENKAQNQLSSVLSGFKDEDSTNVMEFSRAKHSEYAENSVAKKGIKVQVYIKEDLPVKRKFEDFSTFEVIESVDFMRKWRPMSGTERNISKEDRREEHARKRQIKQRALDMAKAEAIALREQLEEIEAAAVAKEEAEEKAELDEVDRQIELAIKDSETLKAKIRELQNREAQ